MSQHSYVPTCVPCRTQDTTTFHRSCAGCQARRAHIEARRRDSVHLTPGQVDGMDSTMQLLEPPKDAP